VVTRRFDSSRFQLDGVSPQTQVFVDFFNSGPDFLGTLRSSGTRALASFVEYLSATFVRRPFNRP